MASGAASAGDRDQGAVIAFLADPATHGVAGAVRRIDTHGAIVFLAGDRAYKLKRAVRFPFMDLSTVEKRRQACENEITVNQPGAPQIYIDTVPISRDTDGLRIAGSGTPLDWVVRMHRFDDTRTLDHVASDGGLNRPLLRQVVAAILASHKRAPLRDGVAATGSLATYIDQNEAAFAEAPALFPPEMASLLTTRSRAALAACRDLLHERGGLGFVRRCHGDLHCRNIVLLDGAPVLFDAVEFSDAIATCDVLYDLAFLLMDLWERGLRTEANTVLNLYLAAAGDERHLAGLAALPIFLSIRAGLRAKIAASTIAVSPPDQRAAISAEARRYFDHALAFLAPAAPRLLAIGGLSGSGKTTLASALAPGLGAPPGAVHLRSDIERKQLFDIDESEKLPVQAYSAGQGERVYAQLEAKTARALAAGWTVIVDAVFARPGEREVIAAIAREAGADFAGLWLDAPPARLVDRVNARQGDASDADAAVVRQQLDYETGPIDWIRLDASGSPADVLARAGVALKPRSL